MDYTFGGLVAYFRRNKKIVLREFCNNNNHNCRYISAIERGITPVPDDEKFLKKLEQSLQLNEEDSKLFWKIARKDKGKVYYSMKDDRNLIPSLPVFEIGNMAHNKEKFMEFVEEMKNSGEFSEEERY